MTDEIRTLVEEIDEKYINRVRGGAIVICTGAMFRLYSIVAANWPTLRAALTGAERESGCPCLYTEPCDPSCTCVNPVSSRGCARCCTYGSLEQRKANAKRLAAPAAPTQGELLPCPCCGLHDIVPALHSELHEDDGGEDGWYFICDAEGGKPGCGTATGWHKDKEGARNAWNRRAPAAPGTSPTRS